MIVLKDLKGWEMQAIVDFMYKGEISVGHEQLASLMAAAESLQVYPSVWKKPNIESRDIHEKLFKKM